MIKEESIASSNSYGHACTPLIPFAAVLTLAGAEGSESSLRFLDCGDASAAADARAASAEAASEALEAVAASELALASDALAGAGAELTAD